MALSLALEEERLRLQQEEEKSLDLTVGKFKDPPSHKDSEIKVNNH